MYFGFGVDGFVGESFLKSSKHDKWSIGHPWNDERLFLCKNVFITQTKISDYSWQGIIRLNFTNFKQADDDFEPICLNHKYWEVIKLDLLDFVKWRFP